jgi:hypothetical protein
MAGFGYGSGAPSLGGAPGTPGSGSGGGTGFFDDPTKLGWAKLGLDLFGGIAGGIQQGKMSAAEIAERQREFDKAFGLQSGQAALGASRSLESAPMRDRVMFKLQQLLAQTPSDYKPHDIFNGGGVAQRGGYDTGKLQAADTAYAPSAGGVNTDIIKKFLDSLGYGAPTGPRIGPRPTVPQGVTL